MPSHRHSPPRRIAPVLIALVLAGVLAAAPPGTAAPAGASATVGADPALCRLQGQLPRPLWNRLARLLHVRCGPRPTTTTTTTTRSSTSSSTTTTTTTTRSSTSSSTTTTLYIPADNWGLEGSLFVVTCEGSPEAPGTCGNPVGTAGRVRVGSRIVETGPTGGWSALGLFSVVELQGIVEPPPNLIAVCPVTMGDPSDGGPYNNRADVTCYVYRA